MIHQQILAPREKVLALIAATLMIVLVVVGYTKTAGTSMQTAAATYNLHSTAR